MQVEVHDQIEPLLPEWQRLFDADPEATPFVSPGWVRAWWRHWSGPWRPWLLAVRNGGELVALAPLVRRRRGPLTVVRVLGEEPGDYWNVLAVPELRGPALRSLAAELRRRRSEWDAFALKRLPWGSLTQAEVLRSGLRHRPRGADPCPVIELPGSFDAYLATLPPSRRSNLRRHLRRLDEGRVELRELHDPETLPGAIDRWQRLRVEQWRAAERELDPEHASARFRAFMLDAARALVPARLCLVWEFVAGGEPVGVYVNFADARSFYWYLGGFAPHAAALGIGKIAIGEGIRTSIAAGRRRFDFLRGGESYKYWYGAADRPSPSILLHSGRVRSRLAVRLGTATGRL